MFIYISNKQLKQSAAQLISFFLVDLLSRWHSRSFQSLVQALRDSRSYRGHIEIRLMNSRTSIDPTIFFVFDRKLTLHIHIGQFHIWEALYENNLLTLRSFWSLAGFKIFSKNGNFEKMAISRFFHQKVSRVPLSKILGIKLWNGPYE